MAFPTAFLHEAWDLKYVVYHFPKAGDELPLHVHHDNEHISIVGAGRFLCFDDNGKEKELGVGESILFHVGRQHGLRALTDMATLVQCWQPGYKQPCPPSS
jgi:quercetin dioxygenase-like cupin family protein